MLVESVNGLSLSLADLDGVLARLYADGKRVSEMRMGTDAIIHFAHLAEAADAVIQVDAQMQEGNVTGIRVSGYADPLTGEVIPISHLPEDRERIEFHALAA